ncbi:unnamed protein product [Paramecium octaurelia]|uniref:Uncharacterized protein n=1 Tax=Paramecium octaurelia TaxID=43137 RepID=A0A8S1U339_PAROT|nr:unnamed protein product [Paramecium octaurelia]
MRIMSCQSVFLMMVLHSHLVEMITLSIYWMLRQNKKQPNQMVIQSCVISICYSPDGTALASGSGDNSICLWDVQTGQQIAKFDGHTNYVRELQFSPIISINYFSESVVLLQFQRFLKSQFQAQGALILEGEFVDSKGDDLLSLFQGSLILENQICQKQNMLKTKLIIIN